MPMIHKIRNLTTKFVTVLLTISIVIFPLFAQPVFGLTPPYSSIVSSYPPNGYCYYVSGAYGGYWECVNGNTSNGSLIILANASANSGYQYSSGANIMFLGPELTTTSSTATVGETLSFNGAVATYVAGAGSSADGIFYALLAYQWTWCGQLPCSTNTVSSQILIWDAAIDGSYVISCSQCGYSWQTSLHSSWLNQYYAAAGSKTSATAISSCSLNCFPTVWGKADFSNGGYNNVVNAITLTTP
jgi:hypothetical protein